MVAKLIADFSGNGWCYVSFAVVTDHGSVFTDEFFIQPSTDIRYITSSFLLAPEDTSPEAFGTEAFVIFNVEIYDTYSEGGSETITINITRGRLMTTPLTPLNVEGDTNTTLGFKIASIHNENVTYTNEPATVTIHDSEQNFVHESNTSTNSNGEVFFEWSPSIGPPGDYNLTLTTLGNDAFLPMTQSFSVIAEPPTSRLNIVTSTDTVHCQSPDGSRTEDVHLFVEHLNDADQPITDSIIEWKTSFSEGNLTNLGDGNYESYIPFRTNSGTYQINLTTTNPIYQVASNNTIVEVTKRSLNLNSDSTLYGISGELITIPSVVIDNTDGIVASSIPVTITLSLNSTVIDSVQGLTNENGQFNGTIQIPDWLWGSGIVQIIINESVHYEAYSTSFPLDVYYHPDIISIEILPPILGQDTETHVYLSDPSGNAIQGVQVELHNNESVTLSQGVSDSNGLVILHWFVDPETNPGPARYSFVILGDLLQGVYNTTITTEPIVYYPLRFEPEDSTLSGTRGNQVDIEFMVESEFSSNQSITVTIHEFLDEFSFSYTIQTDTIVTIPLLLSPSYSTGLHIVDLLVDTNGYQFVGTRSFNLVIQGLLSSTINSSSAYYGEQLELDMVVSDEYAISVDIVSIYAYFDGEFTPSIALENVSSNDLLRLPLPFGINPGHHDVFLEIHSPWFLPTNESFTIVVWMRTSIVITMTPNLSYPIIQQTSRSTPTIQPDTSALSISSGSIMSPPPILFNGTTSLELSTARTTSLDNCPRLSSGTSNRSTDSPNRLISSSGNGQSVLSLRDLNDTGFCFLAIISSTDFEVLPNDIIPQSASSGPDMTTSVNKSEFSRIFPVILRTS